MEELGFNSIAILVSFGFLAAFIDAAVGGGGLVSVPALLFVGLPPHIAIATNKLSAFFGLVASSYKFLKQKEVDYHLILKVAPLALVGAALGAYVLQFVSSEVLRPLVLVLLVLVAVYTFFKKDAKEQACTKQLSRRQHLIFLGIAFCIAVYDGFFGPGTGSFLIITSVLFGFNFLKAAGNSKLINLLTNVAALAVYFSLGMVNITYGVIMGFAMVVGAYLGASFAIKKGVVYIRILLLLVTGALIVSNSVILLVEQGVFPWV